MYTQTILEHVHTNDSGTCNHKRWWIVRTRKTLEFVHTKDWEHAQTQVKCVLTKDGKSRTQKRMNKFTHKRW